VVEVYLNDAGIAYEAAEQHFAEAAAWATQHCDSFEFYHVQDVSDVSYQYDFVTMYRFRDEKDALLFRLKWQ
jgi:hypothetical protein